MSQVRHVNIVRLVGYKFELDKISIFMELFDCSLKALIQKRVSKRRQKVISGWFSPEEIQIWFEQILAGLECLHDQGISHHDIKPENVLVNLKGIGKQSVESLHLADFNISSEYGRVAWATAEVGTQMYMAPEVYQKKYHPFKADIWSLGIVLYEMMTGELPEEVKAIGPSQLHRLQNTPDEFETPKPIQLPLKKVEVREELKTVFYSCTKLNPKERPGAKALRNEILSWQSQETTNCN